METKEMSLKIRNPAGTPVSSVLDVISIFDKGFSQLVESVTFICGLMVFVFMFIITADVIGRFLFSKIVPGSFEMGEFMMAFVVFFSMARVLISGRHLRVTLAIDLVPGRYRRYFGLFSSGLGFMLTALISRYSLPFAMRSLALGETGISFPIPLYPAKFAFFAGSTLFCISFLLEFVHHLFPAAATLSSTGEENE